MKEQDFAIRHLYKRVKHSEEDIKKKQSQLRIP